MEKVVILTFSKFLCVSQKFCAEHLGKVFQLLQSKTDKVNKGNLIICIGDLFNRFPNVMQENKAEVFKLLHDESSHVRKNALMVISHLILNDMLKVGDKIVDIVMLLDDSEVKIRDLVQLFLQEYNSKGSANIYNQISVAITRLSTEFASIPQEKFETIAHNLLIYIEKEKQTENLVDQLSRKVKDTENETELRNTVFCLSKLKYSERSLSRLMESFDFFRLKLKHQCVRIPLQELMASYKTAHRMRMKGEFKEKFEEFDALLAADEEKLLKTKASNT